MSCLLCYGFPQHRLVLAALSWWQQSSTFFWVHRMSVLLYENNFFVVRLPSLPILKWLTLPKRHFPIIAVDVASTMTVLIIAFDGPYITDHTSHHALSKTLHTHAQLPLCPPPFQNLIHHKTRIYVKWPSTFLHHGLFHPQIQISPPPPSTTPLMPALFPCQSIMPPSGQTPRKQHKSYNLYILYPLNTFVMQTSTGSL